MYVKVRKKGNQWFRIDNGTLVGTEISLQSQHYKKLSEVIGDQIVIKNTNNELKIVYYGYFFNNKFTRLDPSKEYSDKTCGYYVFVLD